MVKYTLIMFSFVRRQLEFVFFGAITLVVALFYFLCIQGGFMLEKIKIVFSGIVSKIKELLVNISKPIAITDQESYNKAKMWLKKALISCGVCLILGIFYAGIIKKMIEIPGFICFVLGEWSLLGLATFILNLGEIFNIDKMSFLGKLGYNIGKDFKETNVNVEHQFGNTYKVTTNTTHKGFLFSVIAIGIRFLFWMYFSVFVGPVITVKKVILTVKEIKEYPQNQI